MQLLASLNARLENMGIKLINYAKPVIIVVLPAMRPLTNVDPVQMNFF